MDTKQVLEGALGLMEQGWSRCAFARREDGTPTIATDPVARSFCARGAIYCASQGDLEANTAAYKALEATLGASVIFWNDDPGTTFSDVRMAFRRTIGSKSLAEALVAA